VTPEEFFNRTQRDHTARAAAIDCLATMLNDRAREIAFLFASIYAEHEVAQMVHDIIENFRWHKQHGRGDEFDEADIRGAREAAESRQKKKGQR
jgi:hypothetical protein